MRAAGYAVGRRGATHPLLWLQPIRAGRPHADQPMRLSRPSKPGMFCGTFVAHETEETLFSLVSQVSQVSQRQRTMHETADRVF